MLYTNKNKFMVIKGFFFYPNFSNYLILLDVNILLLIIIGTGLIVFDDDFVVNTHVIDVICIV